LPKYYTPTADELHDGFKYQIKSGEEWKDSFMKYDTFILPLYRVKYLDIDDIKELGFTIKKEMPDCTYLSKNIVSEKLPFYYLLIFRLENELPFIEIQDMYNHPVMAKVHIKNKSELQWLLNRYGIL
jgi:hypothetical protein